MAFKNKLRKPRSALKKKELVSRDFYRRQQQRKINSSSCLQLVDGNGFSLIDGNGFNICVSG